MAPKKTIDQCLEEFHGCMTTRTLAPAPAARMSAPAPAARAAVPAPKAAAAQYKTGADNITRINKIFSSMQSQQGRSGATCDDAAKKFSNFWNSKGLVVVPAANGCPTGMVLPTGKDSTPIEGLVPCLPSGKTFGDLIGPGGLPSDLQTAMQACTQQVAVKATANYVMKPGVSAYGGDPNLASKRLNVVTGTVDQCKAACDANSKCTHFTQTGSSCQLYSGGEWVGTQPGTNSYCKSQCQGGGGTSGYALEGSPFGGVVGGRNWKLILTLFVLVIMLWILAKKM